jgi:outer membrane receptor for ferrienterochelin and colicins
MLAHCLALAAGLVIPAVSAGQTQSDQDLMSLSIEDLAHTKIFSASRHLEDSRQAPSSVSIITADDIKRYGWRTLADALGSLRGFYTSYDRSYSYLGVRGFLRPGDYNSRILLMVNGHRLNDNVFDEALIGEEFPLNLDLVDHIEIVRGPGSSLFGTNAIFGVINVITRQTTSGTTVEASGDTSSFLGRTGRLTANFQRGKLSGIFSGNLYRSAGHSKLFYPEYDTPETNFGIADDVDGERSGRAFGDVQYGNLRLQGLFGARTKIMPTGMNETNFNDPTDRITDSRAFVEASYHWEVSIGDIDTRVFYDWSDFKGVGALGGPDPANRYVAETLANSDWVGTETTLGRQIGRNRIIVGGDYEYSIKIEQMNRVVGQPPPFHDNRQPWLAAVFGEMELNVVPRLSVRLGGRSDWADEYGNALSPRFALVYSVARRTTLKYIYGRAFRAPSAYEGYYSDGIVLEAPSSRLRPETSGSHEVILERGLTSWLQMMVDGSYNRLGSLIDQVPDPSNGLTHFVNIGKDRGRAVETEIDAKRASGWAARASYSLADATDELQHARLANSPLQMAKLNGTVPLARRAFAGVELLYASAQTSYQNSRVPSSFLTNVTLSTKPLWGGWEFSTSCYNAFNRLWYSPAGPELEQAEIQQDGRSYRFKISYRLHSEQGGK